MSTQSIELLQNCLADKRQRLIDRAEVEHIVGMKRSAIYSRIALGLFPKPVPIGGPAGKPTAVRWLESDVILWLEARIAERDAA
jgi:prophage regulatory protein